MNKEIQPKSHLVTFKCASCAAVYEINSTLKQDYASIDVCSNCHPFYKNGATTVKVKGRAEKLSSKFEAGKQTLSAGKTKIDKAKSSKQKTVKTLEDLK